ncbi:hypothetical protein GPJ61_14895 [Brevibacillus formosus]|nr:FDLD family class I lanthipeptide [Brevibacillus formosus]MBW5469148.1 hypothetical protein [Brevibacillus formosus]
MNKGMFDLDVQVNAVGSNGAKPDMYTTLTGNTAYCWQISRLYCPFSDEK